MIEMGKISMAMIKRIRDKYETILKRDSLFESEDAKILILREQIDFGKKASDKISSFLEEQGYKSGIVTCSGPNWNGTFNIEVTISADSETIPLVEGLEIAKRARCEKYRKKYRELEEWEISCIKAGEILPFDLPDVPPVEPGIRCD